jgi:hypothetical protein
VSSLHLLVFVALVCSAAAAGLVCCCPAGFAPAFHVPLVFEHAVAFHREIRVIRCHDVVCNEFCFLVRLVQHMPRDVQHGHGGGGN